MGVWMARFPLHLRGDLFAVAHPTIMDEAAKLNSAIKSQRGMKEAVMDIETKETATKVPEMKIPFAKRF